MSTEQRPWSEWVRQQTDPNTAAGKPEALENLVVLDASRAHIGGLFCSSVLAEFGAEVIRIEPPQGDPARLFSPFGYLHRDTGLGYLVEGRNKQQVTLELEHPEGREIFLRLARRADVIIESFRPGVMHEWGIGYRQLSQVNPALVYAALATYGQFGPRAAQSIPDYDVTVQALSGLAYLCGEPAADGESMHTVPTKAGNWLGWYAGGAWLTQAIMAALIQRTLSGRGQFIDVSGVEGIMRFLDYNVLYYHTSRVVRERIGSFDLGVFPYTFARCKDGHVFIAGFSDINFQALTRIMGREDLRSDPRFASARVRTKLENERPLLHEIEKWSMQLTADDILQRVMADPGPGTVATGRVNNPAQTLAENHWWERGAFRKIEDPVYGTLLIQMPPWKMTATPPRVKWVCRQLGQDNERVYLKYLGYGKKELGALRTRGII